MHNHTTARIVIIEDDETIRESYAYLISHNSPHQVISTYPSFDRAKQKIQKDMPDVIILDIRLPGTSGTDALPQLRKLLPSAYIIMLTVFENEEVILEALANGASGYFTKNTPSSRVIAAIDEVLNGGGPMSPEVSRKVIRSMQKNSDSPLTRRETQILDLVAKGKDRNRISEELFINVETVKTHIKHIYTKLNVNSRADAITVARKQKLI
ncbi:response regulator transcription factor [Pedobacter sp. JY14-1]|uniref:response regulator transcription factor n=1 Tax=Pedobacter sp. JY14-1 TaxID=3034151 RepID=UPI0023E29433|nr:response regulator transcription factor [Pedobacter sp. JY14-1]